MRLTPDDIDAICDLVIDLCGVYLDESKGYLIESRLGDLVKRSGCANYAELARKARHSTDHDLRNRIVDAITTNETLFFRDASTFDGLQQVIFPELIRAKSAANGSKRIRIWSAGCSTGQEPYSVAMALCEQLSDAGSWNIDILGTDVSDEAIGRAGRGWYATHEVGRGLSEERLARFFHRDGVGWRVNDSLRSLVRFEQGNLLEPFDGVGKFDLVFCRNVAIYFTPAARRDLFDRLSATLEPGGALLVGSQESLVDLGPRFTPQPAGRTALYRPNCQLV
jgi:chemotaxis protein methyltransferase CheR